MTIIHHSLAVLMLVAFASATGADVRRPATDAGVRLPATGGACPDRFHQQGTVKPEEEESGEEEEEEEPDCE